MSGPVVLNRATGKPPRQGSGGQSPKPSVLMQALGLIEALTKRVLAIETKPAPRDGIDGKAGAAGRSIVKALLDSEGCLIFTLSDGETIELPRVIGPEGKAGADGKPGEPGPEGKAGADGRDGVNGKDGEPGRDGQDGAPGLVGPEGKAGRDGADGKPGEPGPEGKAGADGRDGINGKDGGAGPRGERGDPGRDGKDGRAIVSGAVDEGGRLVLTLTDGQTVNVGRVVGPEGKAGRDGVDGNDGIAGLRGERGEPGKSGDRGIAGRDGKDGQPAAAGSIVEIGESYPISFSASDLKNLRGREITINGETFVALTRN